MAKLNGLKCRECGTLYPLKAIHVCEYCFGPLEVDYNYEEIRSTISKEKIREGPQSLWRYADLLPVEYSDCGIAGVGFTPMQRADNLAKAIGLKELYVKNDSVNPTFSF